MLDQENDEKNLFDLSLSETIVDLLISEFFMSNEQ